MAVFTFGSDMPAYASIQSLFDLESLELLFQESVSTEVVFEDVNNYGRIVLIGTGLTFANGVMTGGTVTSINFLDADGGDLLTVTSANYDAVAITAEFDVENDDLWQFLKVLSAGNDTIYGNDNGTDLNISEDHGNDKIFAGDGGSYVGGSKGNDTLKGGDGWDTFSFEETYYRNDARRGIVMDVSKGTVTDSWGDKDKFSGFEEYGGSIFNDRIKGSRRDDAFMGLEGKDTIDGGRGWDEIRFYKDERYEGAEGVTVNLAKKFAIDGFGDRDRITNIEAVIGTSEVDHFTGSTLDNKFTGLGGVDTYNGGKGMDGVGFKFWNDLGQGGVTIDMTLATGQVVDDGFGNTETLRAIEGIDGSQYDDDIKLGNTNGWAWGDEGDDRLEGGKGVQWFGGGDGEDRFVFASLDTLGNGKTKRDQIDDFSQDDGDIIDLSGIGGLVFGGEGALTGVEGEIRYVIVGGKTIISGDTDGNGKADFQILINQEVEFQAGDFALNV